MPYIPMLAEPTQSRLETNVFRGYNHRLRIPDGACYDTENLSLDDSPMLGTRKYRGRVTSVSEPGGCICKDSLIWVDGKRVYVNGNPVNLDLSSVRPKQLVSMGAYLLIFPDKKYLNTADLEDFGEIEASWSGNSLTYTVCDEAGSAYEDLVIQTTAPGDPENGACWLDQTTNTLRTFSEAAAMWVEVPTVYTRIEAAGIGFSFGKFDGVTISGCEGSPQLEALNGTKVLYGCEDNAIVVTGLLESGTATQSTPVTITRAVPDFDYVCEAGNRLWGCKYGLVDGVPVNELYASKLGDFRNWNCFLGISTDAWAASVGSDGPWTAAVNYLGCPTFFKEGRIHRIYPDAGGAHQVVETVCTGVEAGSWRSACVAGELLLYKGRTGVYAYDGSLPVRISDALGDVRYQEAVAGAIGEKYYISMLDSGGQAHLFTYDTASGIWCREDSLRPVMFAAKDGDLWCQTGSYLWTMGGTQGDLEASLTWQAVSGIQHYEAPGCKYLSRYGFRMRLWPESQVTLSLQYDSDGVWHEVGSFTGSTVCSRTVPVIPRRCDHLQWKLDGRGPFRLFQISRIYEEGSDAG